MMHVLHVVGARPNFMKASPVMRALGCRPNLRQTLVHTGQHYDAEMSDIFLRQLSMPEPDINLGVGSGSHSQQTATVMLRLEPVLLERHPDLVLVYGDVNSTLASALVSSKLLIPVGHVEAGLRSFDRAMPEEINRLVTDQVSDLLFTPSQDGNENLAREGIPPDKVHLVGNVMIDTLATLLPSALQVKTADVLRQGLARQGESAPENWGEFKPQSYGLVTLHRPSNVDDPGFLVSIIEALSQISRKLPLVFPTHPRTRHKLQQLHLPLDCSQLLLTPPLGYLEFLNLEANAAVVITDSGGVQEETTYLRIPCLTVRENTERPVTVAMGTNLLVGRDTAMLEAEVDRILAGDGKPGQAPPLWDGHAAERITGVIDNWWSAR